MVNSEVESEDRNTPWLHFTIHSSQFTLSQTSPQPFRKTGEYRQRGQQRSDIHAPANMDARRVRSYLTFMKTVVSSKGQIVLPAEIRQQDGIKPGQQFQVERIDRGEYRLIRREAAPNEGLTGLVVGLSRERLLHADCLGVNRHTMKYLVDANVLSEATKPQPQAKVIQWLRLHERDIAVDPIILGEIRFGIHLLAAGSRRRRLEQWFARGVGSMRCVPWEAATGIRWARLLADLRAAGRSMPIKDSLIAATALVHDLTIATHNTRDFAAARVNLVDPFNDAG